jgi:hypothetical protein
MNAVLTKISSFLFIYIAILVILLKENYLLGIHMLLAYIICELIYRGKIYAAKRLWLINLFVGILTIWVTT